MADRSGAEEVLERDGRLWVGGPDGDRGLFDFDVTGDRLFYKYITRIGMFAGTPIFG